MPVKHVHNSLTSINEKTFFYINFSSVVTQIKNQVTLFYVNFLLKFIVASWYLRSWWPFDEAIRRSQTLLRESMIVDRLLLPTQNFLFLKIFGYFRRLDFEFNVILMFVGKEAFFYLTDISLEKLSKVFSFLSFLLFFVSKSPHLTVFN